MAKDFLVELGAEELPPTSLLRLSQAFEKGIVSGLADHGLCFSTTKIYATPRRLAVIVADLDEVTPTRESIIWGPPAHIAFDNDGNPTKAGFAFAKKYGIAVTALTQEHDGKVDKLVYRQTMGGEPTHPLLAAIVSQSLENLPIEKRMRWGAKRIEFVRPVHWLLMLFGSDVVDATVLGLRADRYTYGHRFHCHRSLAIDKATDYEQTLITTGFVIADFDRRRTEIRRQVIATAKTKGGQPMIDDDLLDEVTALVEWPVALGGHFDARFLSVPHEALILSMKTHQRYFPIVDDEDRLMPSFITVANIESEDPAQIIDGNERVIRPRLADAEFFYQTDKETSLVDKRNRLQSITFQEGLGTVFDKTERIAALGALIAEKLGSSSDQIGRAGQLCKSDLVSNLVLEFADMQGIAGYYYAKHDGELDEVALAIKEHYLPRFAGDALPTTTTGALLALADRLDTLVGIFALGEQPSGSKDPFGLRRASLAVLRLLIEQQRDLDLRELLLAAYRQYDFSAPAEPVIDRVLAYVLERLRAWYEEQGIPVAVFQAVDAKKSSQPMDIDRRIQAVDFFRQLPAAQALAAANKRVCNILDKQMLDKQIIDKQVQGIGHCVNETLLCEPSERTLAKALAEQAATVTPLFAARDYKQALSSLATLRHVVDDFFDNVMVMTDNEPLRYNRLALLQQLRDLFMHVADISYLVVKKP